MLQQLQELQPGTVFRYEWNGESEDWRFQKIDDQGMVYLETEESSMILPAKDLDSLWSIVYIFECNQCLNNTKKLPFHFTALCQIQNQIGYDTVSHHSLGCWMLCHLYDWAIVSLDVLGNFKKLEGI